jgi:hypothetical protein
VICGIIQVMLDISQVMCEITWVTEEITWVMHDIIKVISDITKVMDEVTEVTRDITKVMSTTPSRSRLGRREMKASTREVLLGQDMLNMVDGLRTALPAGTTALPFDGELHPVSDVIADFLVFAGLWTTAERKQAEAGAAVQKRNKAVPAALERYNTVKKCIFSMLGETNVRLLKFGLKTKKKTRTLTTDERLEATKKLRETRQRNKTQGKRQKKAARRKQTPPRG